MNSEYLENADSDPFKSHSQYIHNNSNNNFYFDCNKFYIKHASITCENSVQMVQTSMKMNHGCYSLFGSFIFKSSPNRQ